MAVEWIVESRVELAPGALLARLSGLVEPLFGEGEVHLAWYAGLSGYLRGDRERSPLPPPGRGDTIVLGDHVHTCYVQLSRSSVAVDFMYAVAPRRNLLSQVIGLVAAACLAELTGTDVVDDARIVGRTLVVPEDILRPVSVLPRVPGETVDAVACRIARAAAAEGLSA